MKYGKGVVKKYSREYVRTLKNGKKKKYKTQQIQITVPKQEDIYQDGEEVLIFPSSLNENIEDSFETIATLELSNYLLTNDLEKVKNILEEKNSTIKSNNKQIKELKEKNSTIENHEEQIKELKEKNSTIENYKKEIKELKEKIPKNESPKVVEVPDTKLIESYNNLKEDYNALIEELESIKNADIRNSYMIKKYKNFILNSE